MIRGVINRQPRFLATQEVLTLHETAIDEFGGAYELRDPGLLDSALAMPAQGFGGEFAHEFPFGMAAAYAFHICKNHPFVDGNKRTALAAMFQFLGLNGWVLIASQDDAAAAILRIAEGGLDKPGLTTWIEGHVRPRASIELRDFFAQVSYRAISDTMNAGLVHGSPAQGHQERFDSMMEAGRAIPAIHEGNLGAAEAENRGDDQASATLRSWSNLLTALYRIAQDMGYDW